MTGKLGDLTAHLFAQIERLTDGATTAEQIDAEVQRTGAMVQLADKIIQNSRLQLDAARLFAQHGNVILPHLPQIGKDKE